MEIQWFPGHMAKGSREIEQNLKLVDMVIYVLDARAPLACINKNFLKTLDNKPVLYAINKADLTDRRQNNAWAKYFSSDNSQAVTVSATQSGNTSEIINHIRKLANARISKWASKGINYVPKAMVAGIPNTGKSSIINMLCGSARAKTGNKPGVTRGRQWVRIENVVDMLDTAGVLAPKLSDKVHARHLAYIGSIKDDILDTVELVCDFLEEIKEHFASNLTMRYGNIVTLNGNEMLKSIALSRNYLIKGGEPNTERTATAVLDDFRSGKLGKISLEIAPVKDNEIII